MSGPERAPADLVLISSKPRLTFQYEFQPSFIHPSALPAMRGSSFVRIDLVGILVEIVGPSNGSQRGRARDY